MTSGYGIIDAASDVGTLQLEKSSGEVKLMIDNLTKHFNSLKKTTRECLEKQKVDVLSVVEVLTSLSPDEDERYRIFVLSNVSSLYRAASISEVFGVMNCHWNYLFFQLPSRAIAPTPTGPAIARPVLTCKIVHVQCWLATTATCY